MMPARTSSAPRAASAHWRPRLEASTHAARFHREPDRRLRRVMLSGLLTAGCAVGLVLGLVALKVHQVRLSYRLDELRAARTEVDEANRRLRVELATLRSLARIEDKARTELGMVAPAADQVLLAREFVADGRGVASASRSRTATALAPRAAESRTR